MSDAGQEEVTAGADPSLPTESAGLEAAETGPEPTEAQAGSEPAAAAEPELKAAAAAETKDGGKVLLLLKAVGDAPIMRQKLFKVDSSKNVTWVILFIRRYIRMAPAESLFVYVSQAFSPAPDQTIGNLLECFGSEGKLVLHYCKTQAWG